MLGDTPEDREGSLTGKTDLDGWLPMDGEGIEDVAGRARFRRWGGLSLAFLLGCGVCALLFLLVGPDRAAESRVADASPVVGGENVVDNVVNSASGAISEIEVDVHGDVQHPGVYALPFDARVQDAVKAAGGYLHAADADNVNAAAELTDGAEVDIPGPGVSTGQPSSTSLGAPEPSGSQPRSAQTSRIDLNTADLATLETLPDIGPARATAIITYRNQHGPFANVSDLTSVSGIGEGILSHITPYLYVSSRND